MSLYNVQTRKVDTGYEVTIRCLYGRLRAVVDLAEDLRDRPDAERIAVALLADRHDQACSHHCVDALKIEHRYPVRVPEVRLEIGHASVAIQDVPAAGPNMIHVELTCPHKAVELYEEVIPGAPKLDAHMEIVMDAARKHRAASDCWCVPDPDDPSEWE